VLLSKGSKQIRSLQKRSMSIMPVVEEEPQQHLLVGHSLCELYFMIPADSKLNKITKQSKLEL
jgi:hypothetical protein